MVGFLLRANRLFWLIYTKMNPLIRNLHDKLIVPQLFKKFNVIRGTRKIIALSTRAATDPFPEPFT
jgi:hypothetical protein